MPRKYNSRPIWLDSLESRQMFNAVNVTDFGAVPNDGLDDTAAIVAAINSSQAGDTIVFNGGMFNLSTNIKLASNRNYAGVNHGEISGHSPDGHLLDISGDNVTVQDLILNNGGIKIDRPAGGYNNNINIVDNVFYLAGNGINNSGVTATSGLQNSTISGNYFTGPNSSGYGIYGYNYQNLTIEHNDFINTMAGVHIQAFGNSGNLHCNYNFLHGVRNMGLEFQGKSNHDQFIGNWYEHPNLSSNFHQNDNSFAFSLILDEADDVLVKNNVVIAPERPDGVGCRIGFEIGGTNTTVVGNYINGCNQVIAVNDGLGPCSVSIKDNWFDNVLQGIGGIRTSGIVKQSNNGNSTVLNWKLSESTAGRDTRNIHVSFDPQHDD